MKKGIVVRSTGSWYEVQLEDGSRVRARIIGKFRLGDIKTTNPVGVVDIVWVEMESG